MIKVDEKSEEIDLKAIEEAIRCRRELPKEQKEILEKLGKYKYEGTPQVKEIDESDVQKIIKSFNLIEEFKNLTENETHELNCDCLSCLLWCHKLFHPRSNIKKENFLFGAALLVTAKWKKINGGKIIKYNWEEAHDLMFDVTCDNKYLYYSDLKLKEKNIRYGTGLRSVKNVVNAYIEKKRRFIELIDLFYFRPRREARKDKMIKEYNLLEKVYIFMREKQEVHNRQLLRHFQKAGGEKIRYKNLYPILCSLEDAGIILRDLDKKEIYFRRENLFIEKLIKLKKPLPSATKTDHLQQNLSRPAKPALKLERQNLAL
jgi:hypothetical protein